MYRVITLTVLLICAYVTSKAQDTTKNVSKLKIEIGLTFVPQGAMNLKDPGEFNTYSNIFGGIILIKENWFNTSFYSMTFNQVGTAIGYNFIPDLGMYTVATKNTTKSGGYVGIGLYTPLSKTVSGFIEVGSNYQKWNPGMYVGMFIPFRMAI